MYKKKIGTTELDELVNLYVGIVIISLDFSTFVTAQKDQQMVTELYLNPLKKSLLTNSSH